MAADRLTVTIDIVNTDEREEFSVKLRDALAHLISLPELSEGKIEPGSVIVAPNNVRMRLDYKLAEVEA